MPLVEHCLRVFVCEILQEVLRSSSPPVLNFFYLFPARDIFLIRCFSLGRVPPFPWNGEGGTLPKDIGYGFLSLSRAEFILIRSWGAKSKALNLSLSRASVDSRPAKTSSVCHSIDVVSRIHNRSGQEITFSAIVWHEVFSGFSFRLLEWDSGII